MKMEEGEATCIGVGLLQKAEQHALIVRLGAMS